MRRVLSLSPLLALMLVPGQVLAGMPLVNIHGGLLYWNSSLSGDIAADGDDVDMEDDLGFGRERHNILYLGVEHPVPFVPNARLRHMELDDSARGTVEQDFTFAGQQFTAEENVSSEYDFTITDISLYYSLPVPAVDVNAGLTVRRLEVDARIRSRDNPGNEENVDGDGVFPMLHGSLEGSLPLTGFYAGGEANVVSYDGNSFRDGRAYVGWTSDFALGVELGYQALQFKIDDLDGIDADISKTGPYLGLSLRF